MSCMKCGRETEPGQVFCETCQEEMKKYPVNPNTAVYLPLRKEEPAIKKPAPRRKAPLSKDDQIRRLRSRSKWLSVMVALLAVLLTVSAFGTAMAIRKIDMKQWLGQNYSTAEDLTPAGSTSGTPVTGPDVE